MDKRAAVSLDHCYLSDLGAVKKRSPSIEALPRLAKALGVPVTELLEVGGVTVGDRQEGKMVKWTFRKSLIYVGENLANVSRRSSKGYVIRRIGRAVLIEWGSVTFVNQGRVSRPRWRGKPRYQLEVRRNVSDAVAGVKSLLKEQRDQGYKNAGGGILPPPRA